MIFTPGSQRPLKPGVLAGGVVKHQIHDHLDVTLVRFFQKMFEIFHSSILGIDRVIVGHIITVIGRGWVDGHQPEAPDSQIVQIIQLFDDAVEIADAVAIAVTKGTDEDLIEYRVVPPGESLCALIGIGCYSWFRELSCSWRGRTTTTCQG